MVSHSKHDGEPRPAPLATSNDVDSVCQALLDLRRHLTVLGNAGGGQVTPALLQAAADDCPEAVVVTNNDARILMVNGAAARLVGTSTRELQKLTIWDITHTSQQTDFDVLWKAFLRTGRQHGRYAVRRADGTAVDVAYCAGTDVIPDHHVSILKGR